MKNTIKKSFTLLTSILLAILLALPVSADIQMIEAHATGKYDISAAIRYASEYYNKNTNDNGIYYGGRGGDCAYFVSRCLTNGGVFCNYVNTGQFLSNPPDGFMAAQKLHCTTNGISTKGENEGKISTGDIILYHYTLNGTDKWPHAVLVGDISGNYVQIYGHTPNMGPEGYSDAKYYIAYDANNVTRDMKKGNLDAYVIHYTGNDLPKEDIGYVTISDITESGATVHWDKGAFYPADSYGLKLGKNKDNLDLVFFDSTGRFKWANLIIGSGKEVDSKLDSNTEYYAQFFSYYGSEISTSQVFSFTTKGTESELVPPAIQFKRIFHSDVSDNSCHIEANVDIKRICYEVGAEYVANDSDMNNAKTVKDSNYPKIKDKIWYDFNNGTYPSLIKGTQYFYRFYYIEKIGDQRTYSDVYSFKTTGEDISPSQDSTSDEHSTDGCPTLDDTDENSLSNSLYNYENVIDEVEKMTIIVMHRLYNPNSGEHFYTSNAQERDDLTQNGWIYEGVGWYAPVLSAEPVYRLYNPNSGDHHYTMSVKERNLCMNDGWKYEGIGWYSDEKKSVPIYRNFNPTVNVGAHNYTINENEYKALSCTGWIDEGIAWYGC